MSEEIKLAADTLRWLNTLADEELPEKVQPRMRDLGTGLDVDISMPHWQI